MGSIFRAYRVLPKDVFWTLMICMIVGVVGVALYNEFIIPLFDKMYYKIFKRNPPTIISLLVGLLPLIIFFGFIFIHSLIIFFYIKLNN